MGGRRVSLLHRPINHPRDKPAVTSNCSTRMIWVDGCLSGRRRPHHWKSSLLDSRAALRAMAEGDLDSLDAVARPRREFQRARELSDPPRAQRPEAVLSSHHRTWRLRMQTGAIQRVSHRLHRLITKFWTAWSPTVLTTMGNCNIVRAANSTNRTETCSYSKNTRVLEICEIKVLLILIAAEMSTCCSR